MKKINFALLFITIAVLSGHAQVTDDELGVSGDRVKAAKTAFITDWLGLTSQESEKFWAIENEYEAQKQAIRKKYKVSGRVQNMSDKEAEELIESRFKMEEELLQLKKNYFQRFMKVVSPRKIALYPRAEREFRRYMLKQLQERRKRRNQQGLRNN